jgi:acetyl esterase/lipase
MKRLGLAGSSAGAITADHVGYALDDLGIPGPRLRFVGSFWGGILVPPGATLLEHGAPPLFAVHGDADTTINISMDDTLVAQAQAVGVKNMYYRIPGGTHGYDGSRFFSYNLPGGSTPFLKFLSFAKAQLK